MTTKNIQDVLAEFDFILDDIETDNDNGEHNVGYYRSSYKQILEETLTQLVKEVEAGEWKDPTKEVPDFEVDVLCDVMHHGTKNHHYAVLKRQDEEDAEWFTSDDGSEIDSWNWQVVYWKHITPPTSNEALQDNK